MKKDQNGFSAVEAILILVVLGIIGAAGWYVLRVRSDNKQPDQQSTTQKTTDQQPVDTTATWLTFSKYGYSFKYPKDWVLVDNGNDNPRLTSPNYKDNAAGGNQGTSTILSGESFGVTQTSVPQTDVTADNYLTNPVLFPAVTGRTGKVVSINGAKTVQIVTIQNEYDSTQNVFFRKDGTRVTVGIGYAHGTKPDTQTYNALLKTVKVD
jgi:hypothetical protein